MSVLSLKRRTPCIEKVDALPWTGALAFACHGATIGVRVSDPSVLPWFDGVLPPGARRTSATVVDGLYSWTVGGVPGSRRRVNIVYEEFTEIARTTDPAEALDAIVRDMDLQVALHAPDRLFVHAAVVGWGGRAIVLPGRSFAGKSTLAHALVRRGATYYSDEFAVLDASGRVHPYARPLALRNADGTRRGRYPVESLGGTAGVAPLPVGLVAAASYRAGTTAWTPRPLSPGAAVLALLDNTVVARLNPALAMERLSRAVRGARALRVTRGDADLAAAALIAELERGGAGLAA